MRASFSFLKLQFQSFAFAERFFESFKLVRMDVFAFQFPVFEALPIKIGFAFYGLLADIAFGQFR